MITVLQWNARSLISNGQEFKHWIEELNIKPDVIYVQETWINCFDFILQGYYDTIGKKEMVEGVQHLLKEKYHRILGKGIDQEYIVDIWGREQKIVITNFYNPCKKKNTVRQDKRSTGSRYSYNNTVFLLKCK